MFNLPRYIGAYLKDKLQLTGEQQEVAVYSLEVITYSTFAFLGVGLVGWFLGCFWPTIIIALTIFCLRCFSGGAHSNSPFGCIVLSVILIPLSGKLVMLMAPFLTISLLMLIIIVGFLISVIITWFLAPVDSPSKPVFSENYRRQLKIFSLIAVILVFLIQCILLIYFVPFSRASTIILALEAGLFWQTFSLTGTGHRFFAIIDNFNTCRR